MNTLKRDWDPKKWSFGHILGVIKCLLIVPFPESSLNDEAGKLFMEDYDEYHQRAALMTKIHAKPAEVRETREPELPQPAPTKAFGESSSQQPIGQPFGQPLQTLSSNKFFLGSSPREAKGGRENAEEEKAVSPTKVSGASLFGGTGGAKKKGKKWMRRI